SPVVADHEPNLGHRGVVLGVERTGHRLVERPAQHVVADVGVLAPSGDALGYQLRYQSSTVIICGRLDGLGGDELADDGRGDDAAPGLHPLVGALDEVVVDVQAHRHPSPVATARTVVASTAAASRMAPVSSTAPQMAAFMAAS